MLTKKGYSISVVHDGLEALQKLEQETFDVILMDLHMPRMGGIEAAKTIRQKAARYSQIPIIALTAHAVEGVEEECLNAGMNGYVSKPIDGKVLFSALRDAIQRNAS